MNIKHVVRKGLSKSVAYSKKVVGKNKRLKSLARNLILEHMSLQPPASRVDPYTVWVARHYPDAIELLEEQERASNFSYRPMISLVMPTYNTNETFLREAIQSVRAQSYENWQLCIVDDASPDARVRDIIKEFAAKDKRIIFSFRKKNGHISRASNDALAMATGEFVGLFDHDDILWPNALFKVVEAINNDKNLDFLYSDEEKITKDRFDHQDAFFKPDWNPEFLESVNVITHFAVIRKRILDEIGGFRVGFEGAQDWDLFWRVTNKIKPEKIYHIPTVLYSWRMSETSTAASTDAKPYVHEAQKKAIQEGVLARGEKTGRVVRGVLKDYWSVEYPVVGNPKVSIVIPSKNQYEVVKRCINSIYKHTTYKNFEIVLVDTGSTDNRVHRWYKSLQKNHDNITILDWPEQPFSYARSCNLGAKKSSGKYLLFLNNDTEVITPNWIERFLSDAQRDGVGAVGCKLYYPDRVHIQHAGIGIGFGGIAGNSLSGVHSKQMTGLQHLYADTRHEVSAVTAACVMIKKERFDAVHGFAEEFRVTYNDVDLCLRLGKAGYRNIYNPMIELMHHESLSVGRPEEKKVRDTKEFVAAKRLFKERWRGVIEHDPHLNPNIERTNASFEVGNV